MEPQFLQRCLLEHFAQVFEEDASDAALAASMFHYKEVTIPEVKEYLKETVGYDVDEWEREEEEMAREEAEETVEAAEESGEAK